jgi:protein SCO1/2
MRRIFEPPFALWLLALTALAIGAGVWWHQHRSEAPNPYAHIGGDFTLYSDAGPVSLRDFQGRVVMLYFGFTSCPDVCPTDLARMSAVMRGLSETEAAKVAGVFVSVDPERDTPKKTAEYARFFNPAITGLSGTVDQIQAIAKRYYIVYSKVENAGSALGYTIDHTATTYLIDAKGVVRDRLQHDASVDSVRRAVRNLIPD